MKVVVIGLGVMGQHHARVFHELDVLYGVYDIDSTKVKNYATRYNVEPYYTLESLLVDKSFNAVSIAAPTPLHVELATKSLDSGLHVFLEKPLADSLEASSKILDAVQRNQKVFCVGYIERFNPAILALSELVDNNFFGEITSINVKRVGGIPRSANNIILDLMTHDINILLSLLKKTPTAIYKQMLTHNGIVDSAQILLDFGTTSATCEANWISPVKIRRIEITGINGYAIVDLINQSVTTIQKDYEVTKRYPGEPLKKELQAFIDAVDQGTGKIISYEDALKTLDVTLQAIKIGG